ncbi:MAG TPA: ROK family protein [Steroidobacteraceae bacterium]|nr:ROK family protein [Steroidobacteraceae bacterium]
MTERATPLYGAIEAGGTKFECAIARGADEIVARTRIATTDPRATFDAVLQFFAGHEAQGPIESFGIASFGPLDLDPRSPAFGRLLATPKPGWRDVDMVGALRSRFTQPIAIDTDVNAAALAESLQGANRTLQSLVYVTVGTGIGGGAINGGELRQGLWHPEMGHIGVRRHAQDQSFAGVCPFHGDCLEGLANGPAILARWGRPMSELLTNELACDIIGGYLAQLAANLVLLIAPERIVFGGGVMSGGALLPTVRRSLTAQLAGYIVHPRLEGDLAQFIVEPVLGERAGLTGAIVLAMRAGSHGGRRDIHAG